MKQELLNHKVAYLTLCLVLLAFIAAFLGSWPNIVAQRVIIIALAGYYFLWGVVTHVNTKTLSARVALEYGCVAVLGGVILTALTL